MAWQKASGYTTRAKAEAAIGRFKQVIGDGRSRSRFCVRSTWNAGGGCARAGMTAGRLRWTSPSTHSLACRSLDARAMSAPPDPEWGWSHCTRSPRPCNTLPPCAKRGTGDAGGVVGHGRERWLWTERHGGPLRAGKPPYTAARSGLPNSPTVSLRFPATPTPARFSPSEREPVQADKVASGHG